MTGQDYGNTPVKFWVQTEQRLANDPGQIWTRCCVIETVLNDHAENVADAFSRHVTNAYMDHQVSVWAVSNFEGIPVARSRRLFSRETDAGMEYEFEQEIPHPDASAIIEAVKAEAPKDGSATTTPPITRMPGETLTGENGDAGIDRAAAAGDVPGEGPEPSTTAFQLVIEDQLKRAAIELEEALRGVMRAHWALNRKGTWWCYQDALEPVARASSVLSAAYLNWLVES